MPDVYETLTLPPVCALIVDAAPPVPSRITGVSAAASRAVRAGKKPLVRIAEISDVVVADFDP